MHELTDKVWRHGVPTRESTEQDHREWLEEKANALVFDLLKTPPYSPGIKDYKKILGLTPDLVEELAERLDTIFKDNPLGVSKEGFSQVAKEAIKWMEERK